jgi:hypothetical protein
LFLPARGATDGLIYRPRVYATARLHFVDKPADLDTWQTLDLVAPFDDEGQALWSEGRAATAPPTRESASGASFADAPPTTLRAASYAAWSKSLAAHLYQDHRLELMACDALEMNSTPGESEGDFRARLQLAAREQRDARAARLRGKFAPKLAALQSQKLRAEQKVERERGQASQQKLNTAISVGATLLGALLGRKTVSAGNVGRATTAARNASRIGREAADVAHAEESVEAINARIAALDSELEAEIAALEGSLDAQDITLRRFTVAPRKTDIAIGKVALLWTPWRTGADGFPVEA